MHLFYRKHAPFFTITSLFSHFKKKSDPFRSTFLHIVKSIFLTHMTTTCPFRPNQIAYVNLFPGISSILDNLNSWRIENTESSRRVYSNMRSTREILSGHSAPYFHDDRLHRHNDRLRYCELPNVWHINIDFTAMKTVVAAIFCAPHGKTTFSAHSFYP